MSLHKLVLGHPIVTLGELSTGLPTVSSGRAEVKQHPYMKYAEALTLLKSNLSIGTVARALPADNLVQATLCIVKHEETARAQTLRSSFPVKDGSMIERTELLKTEVSRSVWEKEESTVTIETKAPNPVALGKRVITTKGSLPPKSSATVRHVRNPPVDDPIDPFPGPVGGPKLAPESFVLAKRNATDGTLYQPVMCTAKTCPRSNDAGGDVPVRNVFHSAHLGKRNASDWTLYRPSGPNPGGNPVARRNGLGAEQAYNRDASGVWPYVPGKTSNAGIGIPHVKRNATDGTLYAPNIGGGDGKGGGPIVARHDAGLEKTLKRDATDGTRYLPDGLPITNEDESIEAAESVVSVAGKKKV